MFHHFKNPLLLTALLFLSCIGVGSGVLVLREQARGEELERRIATLDRQIEILTEALGKTTALSGESAAQLKELSNRRAVIAQSQEELLTSAVARIAPAVVSIVVSKEVPKLKVEYENPFGNDPFFRDFGIRIPVYRQEGTERRQVGAGTGFIVRANGYIVTNRHVVEDAEATYTVLLASGEQKTAEVLYRDPSHDLAIVKIEGSGYPTAALGNSSNLKLGQTVAAIGNALGEYSNSVSVGIISGLNRTIRAANARGIVEELEGVIQTDAAINPGNSGGPLLDLSGAVVGVNVATVVGSNSIGFSIPIDDVKTIADRVLP